MGKEYRVAFVLFLALALRIAEAKHSFVGGKQPISVEDSGVKEAAETIMRRINQEYRGERALILVEIEEAKYQVVAGIKYFLHLKVGESHCLKNKLLRKCKLDKSRPHKACGAKILNQPWLNKTKIEYRCNEYKVNDLN